MLRQLVACAWLLAFATAARSATLAEDAEAFGVRESMQSMDISPSGKKLLAVVAGGKRSTILKIVDAATLESKPILMSEGDRESIYWCKFATEVQLICKYGGYERYGDKIVGFSRLATLGIDGKNVKSLGQKASEFARYVRQFDGDILDWLPDQQGSVLMARNYVPEADSAVNIAKKWEGLGVDRIDLSTIKVTRIEPAKPLAVGYITDGRGNVRIMKLTSLTGPDSELSGRYSFKFRRSGSTKWEPFSEYDAVQNEGDYPVAVENGSDSAFVLTKTDGRDALYRVKLDGSGARTLIGANKTVDIDQVVRLGNGQRVIGYTFVDDRRQTVYFDDEVKKLAGGLKKVLPKQPIVTFVSATADAAKLLIFAHGDVEPGSFYVYEKGKRKLDEIAVVRPDLLDRQLATVQSIRFAAPDGVQVPAYLTLPATGASKNLPGIILPHGGPSSRDEWSFDWLAQFLAARGYAVIQPNYRGSSGYGDGWLAKNGFQGWRTSIGDVTAAAKYLVSAGIADPNKLAIVGWSYGGYAALQSVAAEPKLYKAAVAIAPVTDLSLLRRESNGFTNGKLVRDFVGSGPHLSEGSPLKRVAEIKAPVLMFHGDMDANVGILHSDRMAAALKRAGDSVELVRFNGLGHQLDDSDARVQMLTKIGQFLEANLPK